MGSRRPPEAGAPDQLVLPVLPVLPALRAPRARPAFRVLLDQPELLGPQGRRGLTASKDLQAPLDPRDRLDRKALRGRPARLGEAALKRPLSTTAPMPAGTLPGSRFRGSCPTSRRPTRPG